MDLVPVDSIEHGIEGHGDGGKVGRRPSLEVEARQSVPVRLVLPPAASHGPVAQQDVDESPGPVAPFRRGHVLILRREGDVGYHVVGCGLPSEQGSSSMGGEFELTILVPGLVPGADLKWSVGRARDALADQAEALLVAAVLRHEHQGRVAGDLVGVDGRDGRAIVAKVGHLDEAAVRALPRDGPEPDLGGVGVACPDGRQLGTRERADRRRAQRVVLPQVRQLHGAVAVRAAHHIPRVQEVDVHVVRVGPVERGGRERGARRCRQRRRRVGRRRRHVARRPRPVLRVPPARHEARPRVLEEDDPVVVALAVGPVGRRER